MKAKRTRTLRMSALNLHFLDDRTELLDLAAQDCVLLGRARANGLGADVAQALRRLRMLDRRRDLLLQPVDHVLRRLRRHEEPIPAVRLEIGEAELARGGYVGQLRDEARCVGGERLDLAGL